MTATDAYSHNPSAGKKWCLPGTGIALQDSTVMAFKNYPIHVQ